MSYRTYINGTQVFGNHEHYSEWIEFIESQGIEVDEDDSYEGDITDFMGALTVIENIVLNMEKARREKLNALKQKHKNITIADFEEVCRHTYGITSLFDFSEAPVDLEHQKENDYNESLFDKMTNYIENGYAFLPVAFYNACKDKLEREKPFSTKGHFRCFKLKDGESIHIKAC